MLGAELAMRAHCIVHCIYTLFTRDVEDKLRNDENVTILGFVHPPKMSITGQKMTGQRDSLRE